MKRSHIAIVAAGLLAACPRTPHATVPPPKTEPLQATVWTDKAELYLEYPPLVSNQKSRFAIHLTRLSDFKAVKDATCEVHLTVDAALKVFPCDPSTHPGIFGASVQPGSAGQSRLGIHVRGRDLNEIFDVGPVKIAPDAASAQTPPEANEETINFTKEQQWALDFGTQIAAQQGLRESLRVAAETLPRAGGEAAVIAPLAGRLVVEKTFAVGTPVQKDAGLAGIVPPTPAASDFAGFELAETEAKVAFEQAQRERARVESLLAAGAVSARRAEEARAIEATAQARLQAAKTRFAQYHATRSADGAVAGVKTFLVRAPIGGILAESSAIAGANTEVGKVLFRIVDIDTLFVGAMVPESEFPKLRQLSGAEIEMPGAGEIRPANRLVAIGRLVDPATRTVPVTYEVDNRDHRLAVHQAIFLRLLLAPAARAPVVPEAAVIDDAGRPVVFVQKSGETFQRRPVKVGVRNGALVQILDGIHPGDRVVTKGAYLIRLSSMSAAVPAHGHVH